MGPTITNQVGKLYDDVVAKLPIVIMYGDESEWDEEEKERCLGDDEAFGFDLDEELEKVGAQMKMVMMLLRLPQLTVSVFVFVRKF